MSMNVRFTDLDSLNPKFARAVKRLDEYLIDCYETGRTKTRFKIFETYRSPDRQTSMIAQGVSKAGPWQSAHQFGLAVDFVPYMSADDAIAFTKLTGHTTVVGWNWHAANDYSFLAEAARKFDCAAPIKWDPCHIQHPKFEELRKLFRKHFE